MTAYEQFIANPHIIQGQLSRLWELEINGSIPNMLDFCIDFLSQQGLNKTGIKEIDGDFRAVFNDKYYFHGAIRDGNKVAIRLISMV
jgi:hypothetical protein